MAKHFRMRPELGSKPPTSITHGWDYELGTYRCDEGWNDTTGVSFGCRNPATTRVDNSDLCDDHADRAKDDR